MIKLVPPVLIALVFVYLATLSFLTRHPRLKAQSERQLTPCPNRPNCVSSQAAREDQTVEPFLIRDNNSQQSWGRLMSVIKQSGGKILIDDGRYCHAVFTSTLFRFKDDLEIMITNGGIDIRSASRVGKSDLGQNRKRVEKLREAYKKEA